MKRIGLRAQFILLISLGFLALFSVVTFLVVRQLTNNLQQNLLEGSKSFATLATKPIGDTFVIYQDSGRIRIAQQIERFTALDGNVSNVSIVDVNGNVLYQQEEAPLGIDKQQLAGFEVVYTESEKGVLQAIAPFIEDFGAHRYSVVYDISDADITRAVRDLTRQIALLALAGLIVAIAVSYYMINRLFLKPLSEVSTAARAISAGNFDLKISTGHNDEIGDMAVSVNAMADALKADIRKLTELDTLKTEFMTIASHNLRTPLTVINGYLEALRSSNELSEESLHMVETISASGSRLSSFAEDMLIISRIEAGQDIITGPGEEFDLKELMQQIAKDALPLARDKHLKFEIHTDSEDHNIRGSKPHIRAALWNVIDNAIKFTEKGKVTLELSRDGTESVITIEDSGIGIADKELPKLFTKFHRGTDIMEYNFEGTGLGLYITKLIIENQNGTISINSQVGKGTKVIITIPNSKA